MAELLTVVAILAILMGLVGLGVYNYLRDLTLTQYDNAAKSIYIAAQNSIADLQASGQWVADEDAYTKGDAKKCENDDRYYYVSAATARTNGMLPAGSIEAQVWDGDFVIEYSYETASVFGVFYTEGGQTELEGYYAAGKGSRERESRRNNNPIIGYYGGADASALDSVTLEEPIVSAGRSPVLGVTDPNLTEGEVDTITLVTIEKALPEGEKPADLGQQIKLMLKQRTTPSGIRMSGDVSVRIIAGGQATLPIDDTFVKMSGESGKEATYSIDLVKLRANEDAKKYLADIAVGDEYRVTARVTTSEKLCRPAYGYGDGIWPADDEEVIFTSNIIADYEHDADLYVYRDEVNKQGNDITFNLENWYNDLTSVNEDLYYRIGADERITINGVTRDDITVEFKNGSYYAYPYIEGQRVPHQVTFSIPNIERLTDGATMDITVNVYRKGTLGDVPAAEVAKTLTIHVHVMNQRPFDYHVEDHGSYAEVVVTAGGTATGPVTIASNVDGVVADESSTAYAWRTGNGRGVELKSIPAGGSVSIKFFKTTMGITLDDNSFKVTGPGQ